MCRVVSLFTVLLAASPALAEVAGDGPFIAGRLAHFGPVGSAGSSALIGVITAPVVAPFIVGWRIGKLNVGAGVNYARFSTTVQQPGDDDRETLSVFHLIPTGQLELVQSGSVAAYAEANLHLAYGSERDEDAGGTDVTDISGWGVGGGFGVRHYLAKSLALGVEAGLAYDRVTSNPEGANNNETVGVFGFYGALVLLGVVPL